MFAEIPKPKSSASNIVQNQTEIKWRKRELRLAGFVAILLASLLVLSATNVAKVSNDSGFSV